MLNRTLISIAAATALAFPAASQAAGKTETMAARVVWLVAHLPTFGAAIAQPHIVSDYVHGWIWALGLTALICVLPLADRVPLLHLWLAKIAVDLGAMLICDEMITGFGRTGKMFAVEHEGIVPDIITIGKGFGGGFPVSGLLIRESVAQAKPWANPSGSSSSYGGNPLASTAARVTVETIINDGLVEHSRRLGAQMLEEMKTWEQEIPIVSDVRGRGLMIGMDLVVPGTRRLLDKQQTRWVFDTLLARGVIAMIYNPEVRINPPLVITEEQAMSALATIKDVLHEAAGRAGA